MRLRKAGNSIQFKTRYCELFRAIPNGLEQAAIVEHDAGKGRAGVHSQTLRWSANASCRFPMLGETTGPVPKFIPSSSRRRPLCHGDCGILDFGAVEKKR